MTDRSTWIAEKKQTDRLMTPEGQAQDRLERNLPAAVLGEAQADPLWQTQPETVTKVTLYASVLERARARLARLRSWQKLFDTYVREQAGTPLLTWAGNTAYSLAHGCGNPETNAEMLSDKARKLFLSFIRDQCQCVFRIGDINSKEKPVFSAAMRAVIGTLPESTPELWDLAIEKATPKPLTPEEREYIRRSPRGDSIMQERAHTAGAVICFCRSVSGDDSPCTRAEEENALIALSHAFHCSACTGRSLPAELQPGFRLFKCLIALRKQLIRIASAAADWEWIASQNPDVPADELTKIVTGAYREGRWPRGKLNVDYDTWHDLLNDGQMALYPDVRPDTLYILSAQNNNLGLWRVL
jgi:hypothetical protein